MPKGHRFLKLWVVLALFIAAVGIPLMSRAQAQAKTVGGWEYKQVVRGRGWTQPMAKNMVGLPTPGYWYEFGEWHTVDPDKQWPADASLKDILALLGADGWELVSVTPISSFAGDSANAGVGGATTEVFYWLKRPRK